MSEFIPDEKMRRIVCAAFRNRETGQVICSARHADALMREQIEVNGGRDSWLGCDQGFIDQFCTYHSREDARVIALRQNQIFRRCGGDEHGLYSENLY